MIKRKTFDLAGSSVVEVEEYPMVGHNRGPTVTRRKKSKQSTESRVRQNRIKREAEVRRKLIQYFDMQDWFITLTYSPEQRPPDMETAKEDWKKVLEELRRHFKRKGKTFRWFKNIERGTKGAWHIHLIIKTVEGLLDRLGELWKKGYVNHCRIGNDTRFAEMHFKKLAAYITKDQTPMTKKSDGTYERPRLKEANYSASRNMPLPDPSVDKLKNWKKEPWCKKGYVIVQDSMYEGIDLMGFMFRKYTMVRLI